MRFAWEKLMALEEVEKEVHRVRTREARRGMATAAYQKAIRKIDAAAAYASLRQVKNDALGELGLIPQAGETNRVKIGIVGEVYMVLEPFLNFGVERKLEEMGVDVARSIYIGDWAKTNLLLDWLRLRDDRGIYAAARPYLNHFVGGHGVETVGQTVLYARKGFDGIVQVAPFTCMPEIVAESILPRVSEDLGIPVLTFFLDEHSGEAGCQTRLEAFVDLLERKKELQEEKTDGSVFRY
jgi:predicted nucleotide-binding protein (sugar kinase/HSP70/actin superfamily)